ncbi:WPP domain-associated protein-like [Jatropha curcas]|uniref:WPP domain-associated protein-like n=1 Tax=Jatropha curcas TaxID=180498 RepID=UPI00189571C4|nr:WPP domain-associated protein-like [Jatropha curcas]
MGKKGSSSELLGLSGMDKLIVVDRALDGLRKILESIYSQTEDMVCLSKSLLLDWQQEREFQAEIEEMLIKNYLQSLQEEFEQRLWDQNAQSYGIESTKQIEKIKEISKLLLELDIISKSLSVPESGHLISHGSLEHRKVSGSHASSPSLWEGNGKHDESVIVVPENLDHSQLELLSKDELFNHLKAEMTKMKRHYELKEHEMTENYFSLKREYLKLKERPSSLPVVKDKEFDTWREKILEIILKLDGILMENEKLPSFSNNGDCLDNLKDRLESLCSENHQLKDLLMDKKKEIKCLSSHVSDAAEVIFELREQVETVTKKLGEVNEKKSMLLSISQKHQNSLSSVEAREREQRKQIKSTIVLVQGLSEAVTNFECRATEYIKINSLRLEELCSQSNSLIQKANALKREEFLYKQRLERRCSDLQKAEAEIMEILKLFRRELSGESV